MQKDRNENVNYRDTLHLEINEDNVVIDSEMFSERLLEAIENLKNQIFPLFAQRVQSALQVKCQQRWELIKERLQEKSKIQEEKKENTILTKKKVRKHDLDQFINQEKTTTRFKILLFSFLISHHRLTTKYLT